MQVAQRSDKNRYEASTLTVACCFRVKPHPEPVVDR
jgi:hypothetical protein